MRKLYVTKRYIANNLVMFGKYKIGFNLLNPINGYIGNRYDSKL